MTEQAREHVPYQQNSCSRPVTTQILEAHFNLCLESISHSSRTISHCNLATSVAKQATEHLLLQEVSTKLADSSQGRCSTPSSPHIRTVAANLYFSEQVALLRLEHLLLSGGQYIHHLTMSTLLIQSILLVHYFQRLSYLYFFPSSKWMYVDKIQKGGTKNVRIVFLVMIA